MTNKENVQIIITRMMTEKKTRRELRAALAEEGFFTDLSKWQGVHTLVVATATRQLVGRWTV
jgi:alpha-glucuronidase